MTKSQKLNTSYKNILLVTADVNSICKGQVICDNFSVCPVEIHHWTPTDIEEIFEDLKQWITWTPVIIGGIESGPADRNNIVDRM